jgi:predicted MFS family arabinose efflux permease
MMSLSGGGQYERSPAFSLFEHRAFLDHLFMLIFATVAALVLIREWGLSYAELIPYATPGFIAFGLFSLPSGWLADRWSRKGMMTVFFIGAGLAAIATSTAATPLQIGVGLFIVGIFASIYHPVGLAMVARGGSRMGHDIALNGVFGNLGVGVAALLTGFLIDQTSWRGFLEPRCGFRCDRSGLWLAFSRSRGHQKCGQRVDRHTLRASRCTFHETNAEWRAMLIRVTAIIFFSTAVSSIIFQGTTFTLPKVFAERLGGISQSATAIGGLAFVVFAIASMAQLVVGNQLDPRPVFIGVAIIQIVFFLMMPGLIDWPALIVALCFMLGAFGQFLINDYMIGKMAKSELRASIYGTRYIVSFAVLAAVLPLISWVHKYWGFDVLFHILAAAATAILAAVFLLPNRLPGQPAASAPTE